MERAQLETSLADACAQRDLCEDDAEYIRLTGVIEQYTQQLGSLKDLIYRLPHHYPKRWQKVHDILQRPINDPQCLDDTLRELRAAAVPSDVFRTPPGGEPVPGVVAAMRAFDDCDFLRDIVPRIQQWALELPHLFPKTTITPLYSGCNGVVRFTRQQARCLLAHSFFLTLEDIVEDGGRSWGTISWKGMYTVSGGVGVERIKCHLNYFRNAAKYEPFPDDLVFVRKCARAGDTPCPDWATCPTVTPCKVVVSHKQTVEDSTGRIHVDFANKDLQIGRIIPSVTQEELLFSIRPELMLGLLFSETMSPDEVIMMRGSVRHCNYTGYLYTFKCMGTSLEVDPTSGARAGVLPPRGAANPLPTPPSLPDVLAIDSVVNIGSIQFTPENLVRDLNKAWLGFTPFPDEDPVPPAAAVPPETAAAAAAVPSGADAGLSEFDCVSTGNWGCGAFGGDSSLKFLQQVMAATVAGKWLHYSAFGNKQLASELQELYALLKLRQPTVATLYAILNDGHNFRGTHHQSLVAQLSKLPKPGAASAASEMESSNTQPCLGLRDVV